MSIFSWGTKNVGSEVAANPSHPVETLGLNAFNTLAPIFGNVVNGHLDGISPHWSNYLANKNAPLPPLKPRASDIMNMVQNQQNFVSGGNHDYWPAYYQLSIAMAKSVNAR